jgi:hypothetical protein
VGQKLWPILARCIDQIGSGFLVGRALSKKSWPMYGLWIIASKKTLVHTRLLYWPGRVFGFDSVGSGFRAKILARVRSMYYCGSKTLAHTRPLCWWGQVRPGFFCMERVGLVGLDILCSGLMTSIKAFVQAKNQCLKDEI